MLLKEKHHMYFNLKFNETTYPVNGKEPLLCVTQFEGVINIKFTCLIY